jgi:uncharacterized protein YjcR
MPLVAPTNQPAVSTRVHQRRLSSTEVAALVADYRFGVAVVELVERYGIHEATVHAHLNRNGVERRPVLKLTPEQTTEVVRAYAAGSSCAELARRFGVHSDTVRRQLRRSGSC